MNTTYECIRCKQAKQYEHVAQLHADNGAVFFACIDCLSQVEAMAELVRVTEEMGLYGLEEG